MLLRLVLEGKREDDEGDAEEEKEEEEDEKAKPFACYHLCINLTCILLHK